MDLRGLEIFLAICSSGGLSAAAKTLGITQAAVSQRLAQLEADLEITLVDRQRRPLKLTSAGAYLRERAAKLLTDLEDTRHGIARYRTTDIPELRVGIIESLALALVPHLVSRLHETVGRLSIISGATSPLLPDLVRGDIDLALTSERVDELDLLEVHTLIEEPFIFVLPRNCEAPRSIDDLPRISRSLVFVRHTQGRRMSRIIDRQLGRYHLDLPRSLEFASTGPIVDLIQRGLGWAILSPLSLYAARASPAEFTITTLPEFGLTRQIALVAKAGRHLDVPAKVAEISREILREELAPALAGYDPAIRQRVTFGVDL